MILKEIKMKTCLQALEHDEALGSVAFEGTGQSEVLRPAPAGGSTAWRAHWS